MLAQACLKLVTLLLHPECEDNRHTLLYPRLLNFSLKRLRKLAVPVTDIPSLTSKTFLFSAFAITLASFRGAPQRREPGSIVLWVLVSSTGRV